MENATIPNMAAALPTPGDVTLESKVAFLFQPTSYQEPVYRVEAIETHMSWVFLTNNHAYKLKKPVCDDLLDFRTLEARRHYCEEEVRLNRRMATDVYIGVVPISIESPGHLRLGEHGIVIDWLVKMRRLPTQHMLDYAIKSGSASMTDMQRIASRLTVFYRNCSPAMIDTMSYRAAFQRGIDQNLLVLNRPTAQLQSERVIDLCQRQHAMLHDRCDLFDARVLSGRIVEGHGDLRPEHICLERELNVIDCLEFSYKLRVVDPVDELSYLALECERLGAAELGAILLRTYSELSDDWPATALVHFYQSYRASVRARIAIKHLDEEKFRYSAEWRRRANEYLLLAEKHQLATNSVSDPPP